MKAVLDFRPATPVDVGLLQELAGRIWRISYAGMLSPAQIDHMLGWMYEAGRMTHEMAAGVVWEIAEIGGRPVGYLAWEMVADGRTLKLHKLYLLPEEQGRGLGQAMLRHVFTAASTRGADAVELGVNRRNERALRAYRRAGFEIVDSVCTDIGGGFVMDDHILRRKLDRD